MSIPYLTHACPHGWTRPRCLTCADIDLVVEQLVQWIVDNIRPEFWEDFLTLPDLYRDNGKKHKNNKVAVDQVIADGDAEEIEAMVELVTNGYVQVRREK